MSAAAPARLEPRPHRMPMAAGELSSRVELKPGYTCVPNQFFDVLPRKCVGAVEIGLIGFIIRRTYGAKNRSEWVTFTHKQAASELIVSTEAIKLALRSAETRKFIETRHSNGKTYYAVRPENFASAPDRERIHLIRKPVKPAGSSDAQEDHPIEPVKLALPAGKQSKPLPLAPGVKGRFRCRAGAVSLSTSYPKRGLVDIEIDVETRGEGNKNSKGNGLPHSTSHPIEKSGRMVLDPVASAREIDAMRELLKTWRNATAGVRAVQKKTLAPLTETIVRCAVHALGIAPISEARHKARGLSARIRKLKLDNPTWDDAVRVIGEIGMGAAARSAPCAANDPSDVN
jgi:hypothetical protein